MGRPAKYPPEFQRKAVEVVHGSGRSVTEVARSFGIKRGTLGNWVTAAREARDRDADPDGLSESERGELTPIPGHGLMVDLGIVRRTRVG